MEENIFIRWKIMLVNMKMINESQIFVSGYDTVNDKAEEVWEVFWVVFKLKW